MANSLEDVVPQLLAQSLLSLRSMVRMPSMVSMDYGSEFAARRGSVVEIPVAGLGTVTDAQPSNQFRQAPDDSLGDTVQIALDRWKESSFFMTDRDMDQVAEGYMPQRAKNAVISLSEYVNSDILEVISAQSSGVIGAIGTDAFTGANADADPIKPKTTLDLAKAPPGMRYIVLHPNEVAKVLQQRWAQDASWRASPDNLRDGSVGMNFGVAWQEDQQVISAPDGAVLLKTAQDGRTTARSTLEVDGAGMTSLRIGQKFHLTRVTTRIYTITSVAGSGNDRTIGVTPAFNANGGDNDALVFAKTVNPVFNKSSVAFVNRPLMHVDHPGTVMESTTDMGDGENPGSGLSLRLEVQRQEKQTKWSFDILYGIQVVRPEIVYSFLGG